MHWVIGLTCDIVFSAGFGEANLFAGKTFLYFVGRRNKNKEEQLAGHNYTHLVPFPVATGWRVSFADSLQ